MDTTDESADLTEALARAEDEARRLRHHYVGTEHLLLGLLASTTGPARTALDALGVPLGGMRDRIEEIIGAGPEAPPDDGTPLIRTPRVQTILALADDERRRRGADAVGSDHLLLALVREGDGVGAQVLRYEGVDVDAVEQAVADVERLGDEA